jgi:hypothetical protein
MTDVLTFKDVTEAAAGHGGKFHLLLGNGFSIACRPEAFAYGNLLREADFSELSIDAEDIFQLFGTSDFERVIDALRVSAAISAMYEPSEAQDQMLDDAECVKDALVLPAANPVVIKPRAIAEASHRRRRGGRAARRGLRG